MSPPGSISPRRRNVSRDRSSRRRPSASSISALDQSGSSAARSTVPSREPFGNSLRRTSNVRSSSATARAIFPSIVERRISEQRLLRARPGADDLGAPRCPGGLCGLFSLSAHAVHEGATVHLLGREQIVYVTEKPDSLHRVHVRSREPST